MLSFFSLALVAGMLGLSSPVPSAPAAAPVAKPLTVAFYLQDGVEVLDFAGPLEVFSYAGLKVFTVSKTAGLIKSQGVLTIRPDYSLDTAPPADIIAFFGGNSGAVYKDPAITRWIQQQAGVTHYFSVCTGALMLAQAGVLRGQVATTFHDALTKLETEYPDVQVRRNVRFTDNGRVITTAGVSAGIDGALHLVARLQGLSAAKRAAYYMEYDNWTPGNGLVLTSDNPYANLPAAAELQAYAGTYTTEKGPPIVVQAGQRSGELLMVTNGKSYPLFFDRPDEFTDVNSAPVRFQRDAQQRITGLAVSHNGGVRYQRQP